MVYTEKIEKFDCHFCSSSKVVLKDVNSNDGIKKYFDTPSPNKNEKMKGNKVVPIPCMITQGESQVSSVTKKNLPSERFITEVSDLDFSFFLQAGKSNVSISALENIENDISQIIEEERKSIDLD